MIINYLDQEFTKLYALNILDINHFLTYGMYQI